MPDYLTVRQIASRFQKDESTIRRWIEEGKKFARGDERFIPEKDPGGHCWRFLVKRMQ